MNRSLLSFLLFLLALALAAALGVWWLGLGVVQLGLDEDRRSQPYYALQLSSTPAGDGFPRRFAELAQLDDGALLWRGGLTRLLDGRQRDQWRQAMLFAFPQGGKVVQMITSAEYRELTEDQTYLFLGAQAAPEDVSTDATLLLGLLRGRDGEASVAGAELGGVTANLQDFGGRVVWRTAIDPLAGEPAWTGLLLLAFPDGTQAQAWFREPASVTERALAAKTLERQAWLLLSAG